jgi:hypothetical protein
MRAGELAPSVLAPSNAAVLPAEVGKDEDN